MRLQIANEAGKTDLSGTLPDQSALYGLLDKLRELGLSVIAVRGVGGGPGGDEG